MVVLSFNAFPGYVQIEVDSVLALYRWQKWSGQY